jgi:hypothetical protein
VLAPTYLADAGHSVIVARSIKDRAEDPNPARYYSAKIPIDPKAREWLAVKTVERILYWMMIALLVSPLPFFVMAYFTEPTISQRDAQTALALGSEPPTARDWAVVSAFVVTGLTYVSALCVFGLWLAVRGPKTESKFGRRWFP